MAAIVALLFAAFAALAAFGFAIITAWLLAHKAGWLKTAPPPFVQSLFVGMCVVGAAALVWSIWNGGLMGGGRAADCNIDASNC